MKSVLAFNFLVLITSCTSVELPSTFKKCSRSQSDYKQCIVQAVENAVSQLDKPFLEVGLPSIDPLKISSLTIAPGAGPTHFQQNYKNLTITGLTKAKFSKFDIDFDKNVVVFECTVPQTRLEFQYDINGKLLATSLYGTGPGYIELDDIKFTATFNLNEYEKNGVKYYKIVESKLELEPKLIQFKLDSLFAGNEKFGKTINEMLNQNWKDIFSDVKAHYEASFAKVFGSLFNGMLERVPASDVFPEN